MLKYKNTVRLQLQSNNFLFNLHRNSSSYYFLPKSPSMLTAWLILAAEQLTLSSFRPQNAAMHQLKESILLVNDHFCECHHKVIGKAASSTVYCLSMFLNGHDKDFNRNVFLQRLIVIYLPFKNGRFVFVLFGFKT